jgi:hypothetical protein
VQMMVGLRLSTRMVSVDLMASATKQHALLEASTVLIRAADNRTFGVLPLPR